VDLHGHQQLVALVVHGVDARIGDHREIGNEQTSATQHDVHAGKELAVRRYRPIPGDLQSMEHPLMACGRRWAHDDRAVDEFHPAALVLG
jgi:hypothetical protein